MLSEKTTTKALLLLLAVLISFSIVPAVFAQQTGAGITYVSNSTKNASSPQSNTGQKGYIHTVRLAAEQQDLKWKAYVGNVSSTFVLDDQNDSSIFQWQMDSFSGQVYITRDNAVTWSTVACASAANKASEDTSINHNPVAADSVNRTFGAQTHKSFMMGTTNVTANSCYSTATWYNNTQQTLGAGIPYQEVLLWDSTGGNMIYTTFVENDAIGYRSDYRFDFQAIVPDDGTPSNPALTYFFYLELS